MNMNERIREVRKCLGLTQIEFGNRLSIAQGYLTNIETGKRDATEKIQKLICLEYGVNPVWLETGEGEMFEKSVNDDLFAQFVRQHRLSDTSAAIMRSYVELLPEDRENLHRIIVQLLAPAFAQAVAPTGDSYRDTAIEKLRADPEFQRAISESLTLPVSDEKNA